MLPSPHASHPARPLFLSCASSLFSLLITYNYTSFSSDPFFLTPFFDTGLLAYSSGHLRSMPNSPPRARVVPASAAQPPPPAPDAYCTTSVAETLSRRWVQCPDAPGKPPPSNRPTAEAHTRHLVAVVVCRRRHSHQPARVRLHQFFVQRKRKLPVILPLHSPSSLWDHCPPPASSLLNAEQCLVTVRGGGSGSQPSAHGGHWPRRLLISFVWFCCLRRCQLGSAIVMVAHMHMRHC